MGTACDVNVWTGDSRMATRDSRLFRPGGYFGPRYFDSQLAADGWLALANRGWRPALARLPRVNWKLETGNWKLEAGSWKLEAGSGQRAAGNWRLEAANWKLETGSWKLEAGNWKLEAGS